MRPGERELLAIKINKKSENPLKRTVVKNYHFNGNGCSENMCLMAGNSKKQTWMLKK